MQILFRIIFQSVAVFPGIGKKAIARDKAYIFSLIAYLSSLYGIINLPA